MKIHGTVVGYDDSREGNNNKNTKIPSKQTPQKEESPIYSIPMIKLIPQISNQTKYDIRGGGAVNMLVQSLASLDELTLFSECIFEL